MSATVYQWLDEAGESRYGSTPPGKIPSKQIWKVAFNASGTVKTNLAMLEAEAKAKAEYRQDRAEADDEYKERVDDAKAQCDAELSDEHSGYIERAGQERRDALARTADAHQSSLDASQALDGALGSNNTARIAQNTVSKGTDLASNFLSPGGKVIGAGVAFATEVPAIVGTTSSGLSGLTSAVITGQKTATGYLLDTGSSASSAIYTGGKKILGAAGVVGNVQSAASLITGPDLYGLIGGASLEELKGFQTALEDADLAFFEEWFASDAEELQEYVQEVIDAREAEITAQGDQEGAARHEDYVKSLTRNNMGACISNRSDAGQLNEASKDAAAELREKLKEIRSRDYSVKTVKAGMGKPGG